MHKKTRTFGSLAIGLFELISTLITGSDDPPTPMPT